MAARTDAPGCSPIPPGPGLLRDMPTTTAPKRDRSRKVKSMVTPSSTSNDTSGSKMQAKHSELFAHFTLQQKASEDERRCDVAGNTTEPTDPKRCSKGGSLTFLATTLSDAYKVRSLSDSSKSSNRNECEASAPYVEKGDAEVIVVQKPEKKAIANSDVVEIVNKAREVLQANGPSQEGDLLEVLGTSPAQLILEAYGTLTASLDRRPGVRVLHEDLYSFVYYQDPDDEDDECDCSSFVKNGAATVSCLACSVKRDSGRQHKVGGDGGPRRGRASSSSSSSYESAVAGEENDREKRQLCLRMRDGWSKLPSRPHCQSRARLVERKTCDAGAQTRESDPAWFVELKSTLLKWGAEIAELKEKLKTLRESHAREVQHLRNKITKLLNRPPPASPQRTNQQPHRRERADPNNGWSMRPGQHTATSKATSAPEVSTVSSQARGREAAHVACCPNPRSECPRSTTSSRGRDRGHQRRSFMNFPRMF